MTSLYGRLQRYQRRADREPLEDFLTEALADLLNRMPRQEMVDIAASLFLDTHTSRNSWRRRAGAAGKLTWTTQDWIRDFKYRLDLLASADGRPLLVVEVKVSAGFQIHRGPGSNGSGAQVARTQLQTYNSWIAEAQLERAAADPPDDVWPGALALLTLSSEPPPGFLEALGAGYCETWRRLLRWSTVFKELSSRAERAAGASDVPAKDRVLRPAWIDLALEFCTFLREKNMSTETMTSADFAVAELYGGLQSRLSVTFRRFATVAKPFQSRHGKPLTECEFEGTDSIVWGWFDVKPSLVPEGLSCWVAWGFRFPNPVNSYFQGAIPPLKAVPSVFVGWGDNAKRRCIEPPVGWSLSRQRAEMVITAPISDFSAIDPEARSADMARWISAQLAELETALTVAREEGRPWLTAGDVAPPDPDLP